MTCFQEVRPFPDIILSKKISRSSVDNNHVIYSLLNEFLEKIVEIVEIMDAFIKYAHIVFKFKIKLIIKYYMQKNCIRQERSK